ncbi:hypothetical protein ACFQ73_20970 [Amycolatopsis japonica]|uniref:hypothetical protein n=1 Tax=Amycolatopsis japonica TaxID=208439 RepID=UPI003670DA28
MSITRRKQAYQDHAIWQMVDAIKVLISDAPPPQGEAGQDDLEYIQDVLSNLSEHRDNWNPLLRPQHLSALNGHLTNTQAYLQNWRGNSNDGHLSEAVNQLVEIARITLTWPPVKDTYFKGVTNKSEAFQLETERRVEKFKDEIRELTHEIESIRQDIQESRTSLSSNQDQSNDQLQRLSDSVDSEIQRIDAAVGDMSSRFSSEVSERQASFSATLNESKNQFANFLADQKQEGKGAIDNLEALKKEAENLVDAVGLTATATDYGKYAESETKTANWLRLLALLFFSGSFLWLLLGHLIQPETAGNFWQMAGIRILGAIALLGGGIYSARESAQHRRQARIAKAKQLDLKALDPFIVTLPESEQFAIKASAARRLFVEQDGIGSDDTSSGHPIEEIAKALNATLQNASKEGAQK